MISVQHLTKRYGRFKAVRDLSFNVEPGQAIALWGNNGAGKTTVIRCILGLLRYDGLITLAGADIRRMGKAARRIMGYVPQELAFHDDLGLVHAMRYFALLKRAPRDRVLPVLEEVGLADHQSKRIGELSGGMKQRLALAIALLADPPILILDELTSNLDRSAQSTFVSMLRRQRERGRTIVFTSHRLDEIELLADRVLVLERGRLHVDCTPDELTKTIDLRCLLRLMVPDRAVEPAIAALQRRKYNVTRNGRGLLVDVDSADKAGPIRTLVESNITLNDIEIGNDQLRDTSRGGSHD